MRVNRLMNILSYVSLSAMLFTALGCDKNNNNPTDFTEVGKCSELDGKEKECKLAKTKAGVHCTPTAQNTCIEVPVTASPSTGKCEEITDITKCVYYACKVDNNLCKTDKPGKCDNLDGHEAECKLYEPDGICKWNPGNSKCEKAPVKVARKIKSYELTKFAHTAGGLSPTDYGNIDDDALAGIATSLNGRYLYLIGSGHEILLAKDIKNPADNWANVSPAWNAITHGLSGNAVKNFSGKAVVHFAPLSDGLLVSTTTDRILMQIRGKGGNGVGIQGFEKSDANLKNDNEAPQALASIRNDLNEEIIYLSHHNTPNNVMFGRKKIILPGAAAADGIANNGFVGGKFAFNTSLASTKKYQQILQLPTLELFMVEDAGVSVDLLLKASVAVAGKNLATGGEGIQNIVTPAIGHGLVRVPGTANAISTCAVVNNHLVCGMINSGANTGGIASYDLSQVNALTAAVMDAPASWTWLPDNTASYDVTAICVNDHDKDLASRGKKALILAKNGLLMLENNTLSTPLDNADVLINNTNSNTKLDDTYATAHSGFTATSLEFPAGGANQKYVSCAQDMNGLWYITIKGHNANDGGVYMLDINEKNINP